MTAVTACFKPTLRVIAWLWPHFRRLLLLALLAIMSFIFGLVVVILPPLTSIAIVGLALLVLLWVIPDIPLISERYFRIAFLIALVAQLIFPAYYAFLVPGLPWISVRRLTWFPMILLAGGLLATSEDIRRKFNGALAGDKIVSALAIGFFCWMTLSIFTSVSWSDSFKDLSDAFLYWYLAAIAAIIFVRGPSDTTTVFRVIMFTAVIGSAAGLIEVALQRHFYIDSLPSSIIDGLSEANPKMFQNIARGYTRGGQFRANYIYFVSLSYGEYLALSLPICLHFVAHGRSRADLVLGWIASILCLMGIFASGGRGAAISAAGSVPLFGALWVWRYMRGNTNSMAGALALTLVSAALAAFIGLFAASHTFRTMFTGDGETDTSTDARFEQWALALPKIADNPVTGYGTGLGSSVVGYYTPGGTASIDSSIISLLVEVGVPGFLLFFVLILYSAWLMLRIYAREDDDESAPALAVGCAIVSFGIYRLALTQRENHFFLYILIALASMIANGYRKRQKSRQTAPHRSAPFDMAGARPGALQR